MPWWSKQDPSSDPTPSRALARTGSTAGGHQAPGDKKYAVFSTALVPSQIPTDLAVALARDISIPVLVYVSDNGKDYAFSTGQGGFNNPSAFQPLGESFVPLVRWGDSIDVNVGATFSSHYLFADDYPLNKGLKELFLERARRSKDMRAVHAHGVGNIYWATLDFRVLFLDGECIRREVNTRLDHSLAHLNAAAKKLLNIGAPETPIALPPPHQPNLSYGIVDTKHSNRQTMKLNQPTLIKTNLPVSSIEEIFGILTASNQTYNMLKRGAWGGTDAHVCLFEKGGLQKRPLPAAFIHALRREAVLADLNEGQKRRVHEGELARLRKIQNRFPKLTHHNGANEAEQTVKAAFLWMTLGDDGLSLKGSVVAGAFEGRALDDMAPAELEKFYAECAVDEYSKSLCEAYFRHIQLDGWTAEAEAEPGHGAAPQANDMGFAEACRVLGLGLPEGKTPILESEIVGAFREAVKRWHPDRVQPEREGDPTVDERRKAAAKNLTKAVQARAVLNKEFGYD